MGKAVTVWLERGAIKEKEMLDYKSFVKDGHIYVPVINAETGELIEYYKGLYEHRPPKNEIEIWQAKITGKYDETMIVDCKLMEIRNSNLRGELTEKVNNTLVRYKIDFRKVKSIRILVSSRLLRNSERPETVFEKKLITLGWIKWDGYLCKRIAVYGEKVRVYVYVALELR